MLQEHVSSVDVHLRGAMHRMWEIIAGMLFIRGLECPREMADGNNALSDRDFDRTQGV